MEGSPEERARGCHWLDPWKQNRSKEQAEGDVMSQPFFAPAKLEMTSLPGGGMLLRSTTALSPHKDARACFMDLGNPNPDHS